MTLVSGSTRRETLIKGFLGITGAIAATAGRSKLTKASDSVDDLGLMFRKMRYSTADEVVMWWFEGTKYAQVDAQLTPLFNVASCNWNRVRGHTDGSYAITILECAFYTDLDTGEVLRAFENPITGESVTVPYAIVGPRTVQYDSGSNVELMTELGGSRLDMRVRLGPSMSLQDNVWLRYDTDFTIYPRVAGTPYIVNDWATYLASVTDIENSAVTSAPATLNLQEVTSWPRWLNMGDRPGDILSMIAGQKVFRYQDMPERFRMQLAEVFPEVAADPIAALDRPTEAFER